MTIQGYGTFKMLDLGVNIWSWVVGFFLHVPDIIIMGKWNNEQSYRDELKNNNGISRQKESCAIPN